MPEIKSITMVKICNWDALLRMGMISFLYKIEQFIIMIMNINIIDDNNTYW